MTGIGANSLGAIQNPGYPSGRLESFPVQGAFPCQPSPKPTTSIDRGLWLTLQAIRRQLAAIASRSVSDPFDSPLHQKAIPRRTALDGYAAAQSGHHQVSACSQPRGV